MTTLIYETCLLMGFFSFQKDEIGTELDNDELRTSINEKIGAMETQSRDLQQAIDDYGNISVPFRSQKQQ